MLTKDEHGGVYAFASLYSPDTYPEAENDVIPKILGLSSLLFVYNVTAMRLGVQQVASCKLTIKSNLLLLSFKHQSQQAGGESK